jgi:L-asparaginase II
VVETGAARAFGLLPPELAIMSGSHGGEPEQVEAVRSILRKAELPPEVLRCGTHPPSSPGALKALHEKGASPTVLHNNCSGKHSGMVSATKFLGADLDSYLAPSHPLQELNLRTIALFSGRKPSTIPVGTDGCSAPTFALPLAAMARAVGRFAREPGSARQVRDAMMAHPGMVGRPCVSLMSAAPGKILAKGGAEGVYVCGFPGKGVGLALKVEDGSARAWMPVLRAVFERLGLLGKSALEALGRGADPVLRNHAGVPVGEVRVRF